MPPGSPGYHFKAKNDRQSPQIQKYRILPYYLIYGVGGMGAALLNPPRCAATCAPSPACWDTGAPNPCIKLPVQLPKGTCKVTWDKVT